MKNKLLGELAVCGYNAVKALCLRHPEKVKRLFFNARRSRDFKEICIQLAAHKRQYRLVEDEELVKLAKSEHHQGAVAMIDIPEIRELDSATVKGWIAEKRPVVILEDLGNANNLGAIVRSAAFFGVKDIVLAYTSASAAGDALKSDLSAKSDEPELSTAAYRIAEGGMEYVEIHRTKDIAALLSVMDFPLIGTDHAAKKNLGEPGALPSSKSAFGIIFGNEETGLSPRARKLCAALVRIPGSGMMESLNVAQAVAVFLSRL
jgi:RNA methyltransferase, TrmH family